MKHFNFWLQVSCFFVFLFRSFYVSWVVTSNRKLSRSWTSFSTILSPCLAALYGVLFPREKEAAFANYRMWESLGFVIAFAYSTFLCLEYKLYILLVILVLTIITYPIVEFYEYKNPTEPIEETVYQSHHETTKSRPDMILAETQM